MAAHCPPDHRLRMKVGSMVELAGSEVAVEVGLVEVPIGGNYSFCAC